MVGSLNMRVVEVETSIDALKAEVEDVWQHLEQLESEHADILGCDECPQHAWWRFVRGDTWHARVTRERSGYHDERVLHLEWMSGRHASRMGFVQACYNWWSRF
ncbi:hypothetical protein L1887_31205 [Cichorium endivia]|nr:hypothetical protein L1887_31205 [Cichorium endivia]